MEEKRIIERGQVPALVARIKPRRRITGVSAVLLPFTDEGRVDLGSFEAHLSRTVEAGLTPAVNMDTGHVGSIDDSTRTRVLELARQVSPGSFVAGVYVDDGEGEPYREKRYREALGRVASFGGTPIVFPSWGLSALSEDAWLDAHRNFAEDCERFLAFELGPMFVPFGRIVGIETYRELLSIGACAGAKHSSLSRQLEWQRLAVRDSQRPDFMVLTGNDLAIDMVTYGSDYLLGLSTFAPALFARRDRYWLEGDARFYELNDKLQFLGSFSFREPVAAYKHSAAQFLHLVGQVASPATAPGALRRPDSDVAVLREIAKDLGLIP